RGLFREEIRGRVEGKGQGVLEKIPVLVLRGVRDGKMALKKVLCVQCQNACWLSATVEAGRLVSVNPDKSFPGTRLSLPITQGCPRRRNVVEYFYHPRRLNHPLKRTGKRGENKWREISWEEAFTRDIGEHEHPNKDEPWKD
ncbi:MAG: molybdopterin-dependent oxidoreductase, partial [Deltaproteobacteria bacterium]|nr:molybdopterin-dependent oxidoreductase [Deltaproteobacteria bacterium]